MSTYSKACSQVGSFSYAKYFTLYVELTETDVSTSGNTSKVKYNVYCKSSGSGSINAKHKLYFKLNGTTIINETVQVNVSSPNANIAIASGTTKAIGHNTDGKKTISFEAEIKASSYGVSASLSGDFKLSDIPRYLTSCNISAKNTYLNSLQISWGCSPARDYTQYSLDGGSWVNANDTVASDNKSGWFNITGLAPNSQHTIKVRLRRKDSGLYSETNTITMTTKNIATISSPSDNFSLNSNSALTVNCSNPSGNQITYFLDCPSGTRRLTSDKTTNTSYTWTAAQILQMLQYFTTSNSSSIKIGVITHGDSDYYNNKSGTLNVVNSNPTFENFTYLDSNETTVALTGNNQILINKYSSVKAIISAANKATAKNYAIMKSYKLICGTKNISKDYNSDSEVSLTLNNIDSSNVAVYAIDSRGNSTSKSQIAEFKNYSELAITNLTAVRQQNGVGSAVLLSFEGTFWDDNFGIVSNDIVQCLYSYKLASDSTWIDGQTTLSFSTNEGKFSGSMLINGDLGTDGFNINNVYNIRLQMSDKLVTKMVDITLPSGQPTLAFAKNGLAIKQKYNKELGGALQVNGIIYALDSTTGNFVDIVKKLNELS